MADAIKVEGLKELRRSLKETDRQINNELGKDLRAAAGIVALTASGLVHHRSGRLAASYKGGGSGTKAFVRSTVPYANVIEFGGTVGRGHTRTHPGATTIRKQEPVQRALDREQDAVMEAVSQGIERAALRAGWK